MQHHWKTTQDTCVVIMKELAGAERHFSKQSLGCVFLASGENIRILRNNPISECGELAFPLVSFPVLFHFSSWVILEVPACVGFTN